VQPKVPYYRHRELENQEDKNRDPQPPALLPAPDEPRDRADRFGEAEIPEAAPAEPARDAPEIEFTAPPHVTQQLLSELQSGESTAMHQAIAELRRRGLSDVEITLAVQLRHPDGPTHERLLRRLSDSDIRVRTRLARLVSRIEALDSATWLVWLSHDPAIEVRLEALMQMIGRDERKIIRRMRELSSDDPSVTIRRLARRNVTDR
jgi:hypothetical protein